MSIRFELRRLTDAEWVILDRTLSEHDPHSAVACIYEVDTLECDVVWMRDLGLRAKYASPEEALEDVLAARHAPEQRRSQRPVQIPGLPPVEGRISA